MSTISPNIPEIPPEDARNSLIKGLYKDYETPLGKKEAPQAQTASKTHNVFLVEKKLKKGETPPKIPDLHYLSKEIGWLERFKMFCNLGNYKRKFEENALTFQKLYNSAKSGATEPDDVKKLNDLADFHNRMVDHVVEKRYGLGLIKRFLKFKPPDLTEKKQKYLVEKIIVPQLEGSKSKVTQSVTTVATAQLQSPTSAQRKATDQTTQPPQQKTTQQSELVELGTTPITAENELPATSPATSKSQDAAQVLVDEQRNNSAATVSETASEVSPSLTKLFTSPPQASELSTAAVSKLLEASLIDERDKFSNQIEAFQDEILNFQFKVQNEDFTDYGHKIIDFKKEVMTLLSETKSAGTTKLLENSQETLTKLRANFNTLKGEYAALLRNNLQVLSEIFKMYEAYGMEAQIQKLQDNLRNWDKPETAAQLRKNLKTFQESIQGTNPSYELEALIAKLQDNLKNWDKADEKQIIKKDLQTLLQLAAKYAEADTMTSQINQLQEKLDLNMEQPENCAAGYTSIQKGFENLIKDKKEILKNNIEITRQKFQKYTGPDKERHLIELSENLDKLSSVEKTFTYEQFLSIAQIVLEKNLILNSSTTPKIQEMANYIKKIDGYRDYYNIPTVNVAKDLSDLTNQQKDKVRKLITQFDEPLNQLSELQQNIAKAGKMNKEDVEQHNEEFEQIKQKVEKIQEELELFRKETCKAIYEKAEAILGSDSAKLAILKSKIDEGLTGKKTTDKGKVNIDFIDLYKEITADLNKLIMEKFADIEKHYRTEAGEFFKAFGEHFKVTDWRPGDENQVNSLFSEIDSADFTLAEFEEIIKDRYLQMQIKLCNSLKGVLEITRGKLNILNRHIDDQEVKDSLTNMKMSLNKLLEGNIQVDGINAQDIDKVAETIRNVAEVYELFRAENPSLQLPEP